MEETVTSITRSSAIKLINESIENFFTFYDSYCYKKDLSDEQKDLYDQMNEVMMIVKNDENYRNDLKIMPLPDLTDLLLMCKKMVDINDLFTRFSYPNGKISIIEESKELSYDPSWLIVKNEKGNVIKIINNNGNDITFVKTTGEIISKQIHTGSFTEFFGKNIGLSKIEANQLFIKAKFSWTTGRMTGGYKAFDLNGNELEPTVDGNIIKVSNTIKTTAATGISNKQGGNKVVQSKVSGRIHQNDLRPDNPNGPCLFRALIAAAEEKMGKAFTLKELNKIKKECAKPTNKYIGAPTEEFFVNKQASVIEVALEVGGYKNSTVTWSSQRKTTISGNSDYTIRYIASKGHFQLGDKDGNLLWEPYRYNNIANSFTGKATSYNEISITLGSKS